MIKKKEVPKEIASAVDDYVNQVRSAQEQLRARSQQENRSIVAVVLDAYYPIHPPAEVQAMTEAQHTAALEYLSIKLSIRDRLEGVQAVCKEKPDVLSNLIKESMGLLEPLLKTLHGGKFDIGKVINVHKTMTEDFLTTAKITKNGKPSVADFFAMYTRNIPAIWRILHEGAKRCPSLHAAVYAWCRNALDHFRNNGDSQFGDMRTGAMTGPLQTLFDKLPAGQHGPIRQALNSHAVYLAEVREQSRLELQDVLKNKQSSPKMLGPGAVLPRWHSLLDNTLLTPADGVGPVRVARSLEGAAARQQHAVAPNTEVVVQALGQTFREHLMSGGSSSLSMKGMAGSLPRVGLMDPMDSLATEKHGAVAGIRQL